MEPVLFLGKKKKSSCARRGDCPRSPHWGIRIGTGEKNHPRESPAKSIDCLRSRQPAPDPGLSALALALAPAIPVPRQPPCGRHWHFTKQRPHTHTAGSEPRTPKKNNQRTPVKYLGIAFSILSEIKRNENEDQQAVQSTVRFCKMCNMPDSRPFCSFQWTDTLKVFAVLAHADWLLFA